MALVKCIPGSVECKFFSLSHKIGTVDKGKEVSGGEHAGYGCEAKPISSDMPGCLGFIQRTWFIETEILWTESASDGCLQSYRSFDEECLRAFYLTAVGGLRAINHFGSEKGKPKLLSLGG